MIPRKEVPMFCTSPKLKTEPENDSLEDDFPLPGVYSQVSCQSSKV